MDGRSGAADAAIAMAPASYNAMVDGDGERPPRSWEMPCQTFQTGTLPANGSTTAVVPSPVPARSVRRRTITSAKPFSFGTFAKVIMGTSISAIPAS